MATIIKIKNSGTSGSPSAVATGELAYSYQAGSQANGGDRLYIGTGTETGGAAANIEVVGGKYFTDMLNHVHGTLTADSGIITDSNNKIDVLNVDNLTLNGNSITSTDTNGNINIDPNGTGTIAITGPTTVTGEGTVTGLWNVDNLRMDGNVISSTDTNGDIALQPNGTGLITTNATSALEVAVGTTAQRPTAAVGQIRFNSTITAFEGYDGNAWNSLGGVIDVDQDTYIKAETSPNADNDDLQFYTAGVLRATLDASGLVFNDTNLTQQVGQIVMGGTTISTTSGNSTLTLDPHASGATGTVVIEGDLTVNGTQTTVNSTTVTIDDPVFTLAGDTAPGSDDNKDRGIEFRYHDGSSAKVGFMGWDDSASRFVLLKDATNTNEVFTGTDADLQAAKGLFSGDIVVGGNKFQVSSTNGTTSIGGQLFVTGNTSISGTLTMDSNKITNVTDPTAAQDAATKAYVDATSNGLDVKASVAVATTADLNYTYSNGSSGVGATLTNPSSGPISIDGIALTANMRVLVKDQAGGDAYQNGIYYVSTAGASGVALVLTRATDADTAAKLTGGAFTFVEQGSTQQDNGYVFTHNGTPTIGTDNLPVSQFSGAGQITPGTGLTKSGNEINVIGSTTIIANADSLEVNSSGTNHQILRSGGSAGTAATFGQLALNQAAAVTGTLGYANGGTGLNTFAKGSVLVANTANTLTALDGGGTNDGILFYTAGSGGSTDTISWATSLDGGTF